MSSDVSSERDRLVRCVYKIFFKEFVSGIIFLEFSTLSIHSQFGGSARFQSKV